MQNMKALEVRQFVNTLSITNTNVLIKTFTAYSAIQARVFALLNRARNKDDVHEIMALFGEEYNFANERMPYIEDALHNRGVIMTVYHPN